MPTVILFLIEQLLLSNARKHCIQYQKLHTEKNIMYHSYKKNFAQRTFVDYELNLPASERRKMPAITSAQGSCQ